MLMSIAYFSEKIWLKIALLRWLLQTNKAYQIEYKYERFLRSPLHTTLLRIRHAIYLANCSIVISAEVLLNFARYRHKYMLMTCITKVGYQYQWYRARGLWARGLQRSGKQRGQRIVVPWPISIARGWWSLTRQRSQRVYASDQAL